MKSNLILKRDLLVPIYGARVSMYLSHNASSTYKKVSRAKKLLQWGRGGEAACVSSDGAMGFYIFFEKDWLTENAINHEVRHVADMILEDVGHKNCRHCSNEPFAYLCGYMANWIKVQLHSARHIVKVDYSKGSGPRFNVRWTRKRT